VVRLRHEEERTMLAKSRITTVLPVVNVDRARKFYEGKLGLRDGEARPYGGVAYHLGGESVIELSPREEPTKNTYTALSFEVDDIDREVKDLEGRGVRFEDYDEADLKTVGHIAQWGEEKAAWFKDTEGNILCIHAGSTSTH
jgi:catechol 2,3-dioxygenase-like lactoylglutathione lyase family enzyme